MVWYDASLVTHHPAGGERIKSVNGFMATVEEQVRQSAADPSLVFKIAVLTMVAAILTPTWLAWWNARIAKREVRPNGGSSLNDKVTRNAESTERLHDKVDVQGLVLDRHSDQIGDVKRVIREFRNDLDDVRDRVGLLQDATENRREIIEQEQNGHTP